MAVYKVIQDIEAADKLLGLVDTAGIDPIDGCIDKSYHSIYNGTYEQHYYDELQD